MAALEEIEKRGIKVEGIFRLSGSTKDTQKYKELIDDGFPVDFSEEQDIHLVTGILKVSFFFKKTVFQKSNWEKQKALLSRVA